MALTEGRRHSFVDQVLSLVGIEETNMCAGNKIGAAGRKAREDAFKSEFSAALDELAGKVRFRGTRHQEWIAQQFALKLAEEPAVCKQLSILLLAQLGLRE